MLNRNEWLDIARKLDWDFSYVSEKEVYPEIISGRPWLTHDQWQSWEEPFKLSYRDYVSNQNLKDNALFAVRESIGKLRDFQRLPAPWINGLKLYAAALPLAEFAAVVGNLRAARFGRDSAWRTAATFGALDEIRHTQLPLAILHPLVAWDKQFDWTHRFYHTNNWVAIAAKHLFDELLLGSSAIEFAVATNFVFECGFTNLQFIALSAQADGVGDHMFKSMIESIQTDEARHAQIGPAVLATVIKHDKDYAQYLCDKWFWRSWLLLAIVTGFSMDYLTPLEYRTSSFKEFMEEWIIKQYIDSLEQAGLKKPWYWEIFLDALDSYHHMVYLSAYTYRSTVWFNFVVPGPDERAWLKEKYPKYWNQFDSAWEQVSQKWSEADNCDEMPVHGETMVTFCDLCQLVLSNGTPENNAAVTLEFNGRQYIFCSKPCLWIFQNEPERYASHKGLITRILEGQAPGKFADLLSQYFQLTPETWGKDIYGLSYNWLKNSH